MADNKRGRDKQADDAERRQRERDVATDRERWDEPEPRVEPEAIADLESDFEQLSFPATGSEVVSAVGHREIESGDGSHRVEELVPNTDAETFDAPAALRGRVQWPTAATAMKRVVEASQGLPDAELSDSQRTAYEKTFRELEAIDADDEDEGIRAISDWIVERIRETETVPGSRAVRRQAATFCRSNGYKVRNDEWLGV